ncbi:DNA mismatch repair ATPase MutL [Rhizobium tibeticum]|uniref:DUF1236 domain-containing protein n=1 Tax=Rhizobium tibeticum TaxID=501024 RepID=UPI002783998E|nr:DUF1236 domain-containing protein [Rhizobium tibeticum]MDP9812274.1 DNA mismatch repair ATPase MutL [Rhizobium tibeticum]
MKSSHLTMMLTALTLSVLPLASLPATAQQDTQSSGQAKSGSQMVTPSGAGAQTGTQSDCTPDASGACPQGKGQSSQQKSGQSSDTQKSAKQPSNDNSSTSGSASAKSSTQTKFGSQDASGSTTTEQKSNTKAGTTDGSGSATSGSRSSTTQSGDAAKQSNQNSSTTNNSSTETNVNNTTTNNQTSNSKTNVNVTVEQKTEIRQVVQEVHVAPVEEVNFTVSVGTKLPKKVRLEQLPPRIVKIVPEYEGYRFFILADGRIVIVDPDALTIVYIIEA